LVLGFVHDAYGVYSIWTRRENIVIYNIFILFETLALFTFLLQLVVNRIAKVAVAAVAVLFFVFWIALWIKIGHNRYYNNFLTFQNFFLILFILYYYFERLTSPNAQIIYTQPSFWVVTSYLIFTSGTFFLILYYPSLNVAEREQVYLLNYIFAIIKTILLTVAMFMKNNPEPRKKFQLT
jgi:hypothetical protein